MSLVDCQHQWANHPELPPLGPVPERDTCSLCGLSWPPTLEEVRAWLALQPDRQAEIAQARAEIAAGKGKSLEELRIALGLPVVLPPTDQGSQP